MFLGNLSLKKHDQTHLWWLVSFISYISCILHMYMRNLASSSSHNFHAFYVSPIEQNLPPCNSRRSFSWFHDWSTYPPQPPKTYPRNSRGPLWSGLINLWFPLIRPSIKPLVLRGVTLGASNLRFDLIMKLFWKFLEIVKIHDFSCIWIEKKQPTFLDSPPKKVESLKSNYKVVPKSGMFRETLLHLWRANPLRGWWVGPGCLATEGGCVRATFAGDRWRGPRSRGWKSPLRRGNRKQLRLIYAIVYKVFLCLSCFSD